jgi:peptidoglycan/LPS O-acetylase OafA/YrhL
VFRIALSTSGGLESYVFTFARGDSLLVGGLIAIVVRSPQTVLRIREHAGFIGAALACAVFGLLLLLRYRTSIGGEYIHLFLGLFYGMIVLSVALRLWNIELLGSPLLVWFGLRSYSIYLLHQPMIGLVYGTLGLGAPSWSAASSAWPSLVAFVALLILADWSYRFVERPFQAWGRKARYSS